MPLPFQFAFQTTLVVCACVLTLLAVLTYRTARHGLLNPACVEYQKRVIERLAKLSGDLYVEFDLASPTHWASLASIENSVNHINEVFERQRDYLMSVRRYDLGIPFAKNTERLRLLFHPALTDPFVPPDIRAAVSQFLEDRLATLSSVYYSELEQYATGLTRGKCDLIQTLDERRDMHARIAEELKKCGCGAAQITEEVSRIRLVIEKYFQSLG